MKSQKSTKDFLQQIEAATRNPLGWALLPSTPERPAVRVTVLCANGDHEVWVRHRGTGGPNIELVPRATLTHFVAYEPKGGKT